MAYEIVGSLAYGWLSSYPVLSAIAAEATEFELPDALLQPFAAERWQLLVERITQLPLSEASSCKSDANLGLASSQADPVESPDWT